MSYPFNRCRSEGVSYRPWAERVIELCKGEDIIPPDKNELASLYNRNLTYEEAKLYSRFKEVKRVWMELHVHDTKGHFVEPFHNSTSAKEFFAKFPELRRKLEEF